MKYFSKDILLVFPCFLVLLLFLGGYYFEFKLPYTKDFTFLEESSVFSYEMAKEKTYSIANFPVFLQYPDYPTGCESIALYTLLKFYHIDVTPEEIVSRLPKGDMPYFKNGVLYGGNPEKEFIGNPKSTKGYGVFEKPILEVANTFKPNMTHYTGHSLDDVLKIVKKGIPVQVWVSREMKDTSVCTSWIYKSDGIKIDWICRFHSLVIVGFSSHVIYTSDPDKGSIVTYDRQQFEKMYNLYGKRAIYYEK